MAKNPPAMLETWVQSLGWENPIEKGMVIPVFWPGEFHGLYGNPWGCKELDTTEQLSLHFMLNIKHKAGNRTCLSLNLFRFLNHFLCV